MAAIYEGGVKGEGVGEATGGRQRATGEQLAHGFVCKATCITKYVL